jgi:hypothetical protein
MSNSITAPITVIRNEITAPITTAGRDAYQLAVAEGFVGTRQEWLDSLVGADGAPGQDSTVPGPQGPPGEQGPPGSDANVTNGTVNTALQADPAASRTALGGGAAGQAVFTAATYSGTGSIRKLAGLDVDDNTRFARVTFGAAQSFIDSTDDNIILVSGVGQSTTRLAFNAATASFAALRCEGLNIDVVRGDAGAFASMRMQNLTLNGALIVTTSPITSNTNVASTVNPQVAFTITASTNGVAAATFGARCRFQVETPANVLRDAAAIDAVWVDATDATRTADLVFNTVSNAGALTETLRLQANGGLVQKPPSSITPANNGDLVIEATNNTTVTIKLRGSDGVVRSVALTLA